MRAGWRKGRRRTARGGWRRRKPPIAAFSPAGRRSRTPSTYSGWWRARGDLAQAVALSARALAQRPDSPVFLAAHGAALAEAGRIAEAIPLLAEAVRRRPGDATALRNLGQALMAAGRAAKAIAPLQRAAEIDPIAPEPALALAHALREAGAMLEGGACRRRGVAARRRRAAGGRGALPACRPGRRAGATARARPAMCASCSIATLRASTLS